MNNRFIKRSTLFTAVALAAAILPGCGNSSSVSQSSSESTSGTTSEGPVTLNPATISFWTGFGATVNNVLQPLIDQFTTLHPGVTVNYETKGGYDNLLSAMNLSVSSTSYPNIAVGYPDHFAGYIGSNIQLPLDTYISGANGVDLSDFYSDYLVENQTLVYHRTAPYAPYTMGLPFNKSTEVMVYNKTFMEWAHAKNPAITIPETWEQAEVIGQAIMTLLTTGNNGGTYFGTDIKADDGVTEILDLSSIAAADFKPFSYDSQANFFITAVRQWGGTYTEMGSDIRTGYIRFDSDQTRAALTFFKRLFTEGLLGIPATWDEASYCSNPFKAGKSLMTISSSAGVTNNVPAADKFAVGLATVPHHDGGTKYVISQGTNLAMFDTGDADEKAASWALIKYLTTEVNDVFAQGTGYFPVTKTMAATSFYQDFLAADPSELFSSDAAIQAAAVVNADSYDVESEGWTKFVDPGFIGSSTIRLEIAYIMPSLFYGENATVDSVIAYAYNQLADYVQ